MHKRIYTELKNHAPFTFLGALSGILLFIFLKGIPQKLALNLFYTFHPLHVFFSAFVTTAIFKLHNKNTSFIKLFLIGYVGSIGIATLSDSILPFLGETLLNLPHRGIHLGFIEKWYLVNPIAFIGIITASYIPKTKIPHFGHVLLSTWASLFHVISSIAQETNISMYIGILLILFFSVWLPCCLSDIAFPLIFTKGEEKINKLNS